ncbi:MAG: hypothetical protein AB1705_19965 [Verrucomicrobiota bacterium]
MNIFDHCPNCRRTAGDRLFSPVYFRIYECKLCGIRYCEKCGNEGCPHCASQERIKTGEVWKKSRESL